MDARTEIFSQRLRDRRKRKELTQTELGKLVFSCSSSVSAWEQGITLPKLDTINRLCDVLGVSADWLLGRRL